MSDEMHDVTDATPVDEEQGREASDGREDPCTEAASDSGDEWPGDLGKI